MHSHLRFETVTDDLLNYLRDLGIDTIYLSPIFQAAQGSTHGYDVVDHGHVDESLGTEADFMRMAEAIRAHGMGLMLDLVPNHMGIDDARNGWWRDVLENGQCSPYAKYFEYRLESTEAGPPRKGSVSGSRRSVRSRLGSRFAASGIRRSDVRCEIPRSGITDRPAILGRDFERVCARGWFITRVGRSFYTSV
ncbi:MAG: alpha-amylase family glycosyl hydrolase [Pirellulales bacterium]